MNQMFRLIFREYKTEIEEKKSIPNKRTISLLERHPLKKRYLKMMRNAFLQIRMVFGYQTCFGQIC